MLNITFPFPCWCKQYLLVFMFSSRSNNVWRWIFNKFCSRSWSSGTYAGARKGSLVENQVWITAIFNECQMKLTKKYWAVILNVGIQCLSSCIIFVEQKQTNKIRVFVNQEKIIIIGNCHCLRKINVLFM